MTILPQTPPDPSGFPPLVKPEHLTVNGMTPKEYKRATTGTNPLALRLRLLRHWDEVVQRLMENVRQGDTGAIKVYLDRVAPSLKAVELSGDVTATITTVKVPQIGFSDRGVKVIEGELVKPRRPSLIDGT